MAQLTVDQAMQIAVQHHQAGRLGDAEQLYRQILAQLPGHAGAIYQLGLVALQSGRSDIAVDLIGRAVALRPDDADAHGNLGLALKAIGNLNDAIAACSRAVALRPDFADTTIPILSPAHGIAATSTPASLHTEWRRMCAPLASA